MIDKIIKHDNIVYARNINVIGGVETYVYELVKKYQDKDIAVVCKTIAPKQKERLEKLCRVYIHTNQQIECKVIITNWDTSIIKYVNDEAKVYTGLHTDYSHYSQGALPVDDERITYIGITEISMQHFIELSGIKDRVVLCRNPLLVEKKEKPLILMSATRLTQEKGGARMLELANELDNLGVNYIWFVFTSNEYPNDPVWRNENVIRMDNRLDLDYFYSLADWYVQFSEVEGDSYSLKEALYRGVPIAVCELPYFKEIGIEDGVNAVYLDIDCKNVKDVAQRMIKPLKFNFEPIKDGYDDIIVESKSHYKEDLKMQVKVKVLKPFKDLEENKQRVIDEEYITNKVRADYLVENDAVEIIEEIKKVKLNELGNPVGTRELGKEIVEKKPRKKKENEQEGVWRTIGGRRVFIRNGQSLSDAMKESGKFKKASDVSRNEYHTLKDEFALEDKIKEKIKKDPEYKNLDYDKETYELDRRLEARYNSTEAKDLSGLEGKHIDKDQNKEYELYKQAKTNPDSIDPMTENSTDWEALDKKYGSRYKTERDNYETRVYGSDVTEADKQMKKVFGEDFKYAEEKEKTKQEKIDDLYDKLQNERNIFKKGEIQEEINMLKDDFKGTKEQYREQVEKEQERRLSEYQKEKEQRQAQIKQEKIDKAVKSANTQKALKSLVDDGVVKDITSLSDEETKKLRNKHGHLEVMRVTHGTYGMNGAILRSYVTGEYFVITSRNGNLFYWV